MNSYQDTLRKASEARAIKHHRWYAFSWLRAAASTFRLYTVSKDVVDAFDAGCELEYTLAYMRPADRPFSDEECDFVAACISFARQYIRRNA